MQAPKIKFNNAAGYDRMMGIWSQSVGDVFLNWLNFGLGERWLDIGCGTAILSILCEKKGALKVDAIDIDKRCYDNSIENLKRNKCEKVFVQNSSSECLTNNKYDLNTIKRVYHSFNLCNV